MLSTTASPAPGASERVVFGAYFEALLNVFAPPLPAPLVTRLRVLGVDLSRPLHVAYPAQVAEAVLPELARALSPGLPLESALEVLGARFVGGWLMTDIGRASNEYMRALGHERAIHRIARVFRSHNNFTEVVVEPESAHVNRLRVSDVLGFPAFTAAMMRAGANQFGAQNIEVTIVSAQGRGATFRLAATPR